MNTIHVSIYGDTIIFTDDGVITHYQLGNKSKRRFFPFGCIRSIETVKTLPGFDFKVAAKDLDPKGDPYMIVMPIHKYDIAGLKRSIAFSREKMVTAPEDTMFESSSEDIPRSEEIFISQAAVKCENARYPMRIPGIFMVSRMMRDRSEGGLGGHREVRCPAGVQSLREHFSASIASTSIRAHSVSRGSRISIT